MIVAGAYCLASTVHADGQLASRSQTPSSVTRSRKTSGVPPKPRKPVVRGITSIPLNVLALELALSPDQIKSITPTYEKFRVDSQAIRPESGAESDMIELRRKFDEMNLKAAEQISEQLTILQINKTPELIKHVAILRKATLPAETLSSLNLTKTQWGKLGIVKPETVEDHKKELEAVQVALKSGDREKASELLAAMQDIGNSKAMAILDKNQQEIVLKYRKEHPRILGGFGAKSGLTGQAGNNGQ